MHEKTHACTLSHAPNQRGNLIDATLCLPKPNTESCGVLSV